jgi:1-aminocyclopropane-1-carboxylate deaminase
MTARRQALVEALARFPRVQLATLPTPLQPLPRLSAALGGPKIWIKRDDLTGLPGGGNKTRKLEFVIADAIASGADTLVTVGAIQSNATRQVAAAAAKLGLRCVLLHNAWTPDPGPLYRRVGNPLLASLFGAESYVDPEERPIEDEGALAELVARLTREGRRPYLIPGGASDHPRGGLGYAAAAAEILAQAEERHLEFDVLIHCTGSSSTQAGLLAGLTFLGSRLQVIGVADDGETAIKRERVRRLAEQTLRELGQTGRISDDIVRVIASDPSPYGVASERVLATTRLVARTEAVIVAQYTKRGRCAA